MTTALPAYPELLNRDQLRWTRTTPEAGDRSPEYAILHAEGASGLTTLMFRTPVDTHIRPHRHEKAETHVVLEGGTCVFLAGSERFEIKRGGLLRMPGGVAHEAWQPAGSVTLNILESGWAMTWLAGGPTVDDIDVPPPPGNEHP